MHSKGEEQEYVIYAVTNLLSLSVFRNKPTPRYVVYALWRIINVVSTPGDRLIEVGGRTVGSTVSSRFGSVTVGEIVG